MSTSSPAKDRFALVTGADGFIGSHLVEGLLAAGWRVRAMALYNSNGHLGWLEDIQGRPGVERLEVRLGDVRDRGCVDEMMKGCTHVFHLAALIAIPFSYVAPELYMDTNVGGTLNVLEAARRHKPQRLVQISTSEVYGTAQQVPITEAHPVCAQSPYAATKTAADQLALSYQASFEVPVVIGRPFNTYGPRQSARAIIPTIMTQLAAGSTTIKLGSTHPTRDLNYVTDTVAGMMALATTPGLEGKAFNISSNFEISVGDLAQAIAQVMERPVAVTTDPARVRPAGSEVERLWGDNTRILEATGWKPKYGGLEGLKRGLGETAAWFTRPEHLSKYKPHIYNV